MSEVTEDKISIVGDSFCEAYEQVDHEEYEDELYYSILVGFCWADGIFKADDVFKVHEYVTNKIGNY